MSSPHQLLLSFEPKKWSPQRVKVSLASNSKFVERALWALYKLQTYEERTRKESLSDNRVGFNKFDARLLSSYAREYRERGFLTKKQIEVARKRLLKYSNQLTKLANNEKP